MTTLFFAEGMGSTPFALGVRRDSLSLPDDIRIVDSAEAADVIVARRFNVLAQHFGLDREYYLWTHEPAWNSVSEKQFLDAGTGRRIHVSSAWNGDIYTSPLYYYPFRRPDLARLRELAAAKTEFCVALATFRKNFDRYQGGVNVDLSEYRQRLVLSLQQDHDACHIYGVGWPQETRLEGESRRGPWHNVKFGILESYQFNVALENTLAPNYVTEKLWDALETACVPIFYGRGVGLEPMLGEGAFLDCSRFASVAELHDHMRSMTATDRLAVVENGHAVLERLTSSSSRAQVNAAAVDVFVERIRAIG